MDIKYHAFLSAILALAYPAFFGGDFAGGMLILAVGIGMDVDHIPAYLLCTHNFRGNLLKNTYSHYKRAMGWIYHLQGEPYKILDFMALHNIEVAALLFAIASKGPFFLPVAIGYLGHMALDMLTWCHIIFRVGTRTPMQAVSFFSLTCRLLLGTGRR